MQYLNPFGSSKDRAVLQFLNKTADQKELVEASSGSTAISLVQMGHILDKKVTLFLPDDLAEDKVAITLIQYLLLETLKATIVKVPPVSIVDPNHFFNLAQEYSKKQKAYFTNQFENL